MSQYFNNSRLSSIGESVRRVLHENEINELWKLDEEQFETLIEEKIARNNRVRKEIEVVEHRITTKVSTYVQVGSSDVTTAKRVHWVNGQKGKRPRIKKVETARRPVKVIYEYLCMDKYIEISEEMYRTLTALGDNTRKRYI